MSILKLIYRVYFPDQDLCRVIFVWENWQSNFKVYMEIQGSLYGNNQGSFEETKQTWKLFRLLKSYIRQDIGILGQW